MKKMITAVLFMGSMTIYSMDDTNTFSDLLMKAESHITGEKKNYKEARALLGPITEQQNDLMSAAIATVWMGQIHLEGGNGIRSNNKIAKSFFLKGARQEEHPVGRARSLYSIALIESKRPAFKKNDILIERHLRTVIEENKSLLITTQAKILLGFFYYQHTNPDYNKHNQAVTYFQDVIKDDNDPESVVLAHHYLGFIFDKGINGTPVNPQKAYEHHSKAAQGDDSFKAALGSRLSLADMHFFSRGMEKDIVKVMSHLSSVEGQAYYPDYAEHARWCYSEIFGV